jgi:hypothetical protein
MSTLKLYLTSLEPDIAQTVYSQSIGGFISNSLVYPEAKVSSTIGMYDTSFSLNSPSSGSWEEWIGEEYININNELIKISSISNGVVTVSQRGYNNIINMHILNDVARVVSSEELLNDVFNESYKQYRCIAVKNVSSITEPSGEVLAKDISIYFKQNSRNNNSIVRIAIERPSSQYLLSSFTSWSTSQIVDISLIGLYEDNYFDGSYLKIISGEASGQGRIISSFDSATGTFIVNSAFSSTYDYTSMDNYEVLPAPAQRVKTGTVAPDTTGENVLPFFNPDENTPLRFITGGSVFNTSDLKPNEILYIWIERELQKGSEEFLNNDFVLNIKYEI